MSIEEIFRKVLECVDKNVAVSPSALAVGQVTDEQGIYIWYKADESSPVYIGKATGKAGLRGRVIRQHLNAKYLETRESKITSKDQGQLSHGVSLNGKPAIEKSVFRKHLARSHGLSPGKCAVDFIQANFRILLIPLPNLSADQIRIVEDKLVGSLRPKFNVVGNKSSR